MDYNDYGYRYSPSYHNVMYAFQGPTGLDSRPSASAVMNPVSETQGLTDSRHRVSVGVLPTVAVKVINPTKRSETKLFMLHNVDMQQFSCPENVREVIADQLGEDIVSPGSQFEIGYFKGNKRVWVQNATDTKEVQRLLRSGSQTVTLWCMGKYEPKITVLKRSAPSIQVSDSESDEEAQKASSKPQKKKKLSRHEEKLERVDELVDELKSKHGTLYTNIHYRVWAETIDSGRHSCVDSPPRGKFFKSQGRKDTKSSPSTPPRSPQPRSEIILTPGKTAQLRSTYIQQIKDLHSLVDIGAISNEDFVKQRDTLLQQMDKLNS